MVLQHITINHIPCILWGEKHDKLYIYVHGKMSCKEYAENFAQIADSKGYQTLSFDLPEHGERKGSDDRCDIWSGMRDLKIVADYAFSRWSSISLFGCSLGAYFSLNAYADMNLSKCLFQSPVLDMEYLIKQMFVWFDVTEEKLQTVGEIGTPVDTLRWDYYQYVKAHPIEKWDIPTSILYGGKDNLQPLDVVQSFATKHNCKLTISPDSEHPFMSESDIDIVNRWLYENV